MTTAFLPFATAGGANVATAADYTANSNYASGYQAGVATSKFLNFTWRQSSFMTAAIGQFISDNGANALDDGVIANLEAALTTALTNFIKNASIFAASKAGYGYQKMPSGIIFQWGQFVQADNGAALAYSATLPIAFPTGGLQAYLTPGNAVPTSGGGTVESIGLNAITGFTSANTATRTWRYYAIGY